MLAVGWVLLVALASATAPPQAAADPPDRWPAGALDVPGRSGIPESQNGPARTAAGGRWAFAYAHRPAPLFAEMVARERSAARQAIEQGRPESLALTAALLLELAGGAHEPMHAALALDAALIALTDPRSRGLLARLDPTRRESLRAALERLDVRDPAGMRTLAESLAGRRLDALAHALHDPADALPRLDAMLAASGWTAPDARRGPAGRQRAQDRPEYRTIGRHDVAELDGMVRRHLFLPPTEAPSGVPVGELARKLQRARNFARRIGDLWDHPDGPRVHDFILDAAMRDATGIIRLVHADTTLLAQHDRLRRWRLREAIQRLADGP